MRFEKIRPRSAIFIHLPVESRVDRHSSPQKGLFKSRRNHSLSAHQFEVHLRRFEHSRNGRRWLKESIPQVEQTTTESQRETTARTATYVNPRANDHSLNPTKMHSPTKTGTTTADIPPSTPLQKYFTRPSRSRLCTNDVSVKSIPFFVAFCPLQKH